ncbi:sensor histidine kinase [Nocardiopsis coralliicola]
MPEYAAAPPPGAAPGAADDGESALGRWVALGPSGRAPRAVALLFWGAFLGHLGAVLLVAAASAGVGDPAAAPGAPPGLLAAVHVAALAGAGLLWPLLRWGPDAAGRLRPLAVWAGFLAATLTVTATSGGPPVFVMLSLALGNAVVVLGLRRAVAVAAAVVAVPAALFPLSGGSLARGLVESFALLGTVLAVLLLFAGLLVARDRAERNRALLVELGQAHRALEQAHAELRCSADRVRDLAVAEERARMAREMHDSIGHHLTVITMGLANAERFRTARPDAAWDEVADAKRLTADALADTRRWVRALRPLSLEGRAGPEAVRALAAAFDTPGGTPRVRVACSGAWPAPDEEAELACYRLVQEGLTNAVRHSAAERIDVRLVCAPAEIEVSVVDDGRGADGAAAGFGLGGLRERVAALGGALHSGTRSGGGFALRAVLPLRPAGAPRPAKPSSRHPAGAGAGAAR